MENFKKHKLSRQCMQAIKQNIFNILDYILKSKFPKGERFGFINKSELYN